MTSKLFAVVRATEEQLRMADSLAKLFHGIELTIERIASPSRERSLAFTHLELACFYAKKAYMHEPKKPEAESEA